MAAVELLETKQHRLETTGRHLFPFVNPVLAILPRDAQTIGAVSVGSWICCALAELAQSHTLTNATAALVFTGGQIMKLTTATGTDDKNTRICNPTPSTRLHGIQVVAYMVEALCYKPEVASSSSNEVTELFFNLPNPSDRTRPWG
jgi:hypothetical protein